MTAAARIDAFLERLKTDPDLLPILVVLAPYRAMMRDPAALAATLDALAAHWAATGIVPVESQT